MMCEVCNKAEKVRYKYCRECWNVYSREKYRQRRERQIKKNAEIVRLKALLKLHGIDPISGKKFT